MRSPFPPEPSDELAQLQRLRTLCRNLFKEMAKPDTEWLGELLQQIRAEFERQRREQRKVVQQLNANAR